MRHFLKYIGVLSHLVAIAVVVLAALPFGSVDISWVALWCVLMALSLVTANLNGLSPPCTRDILIVSCVLICILIVVYIQISAHSLSEFQHPSWQQAEGALKQPLKAYVAADLGSAIAEIGSLLLAFMTFLRFRILSVRRSHAQQIIKWLAYISVFYALISGIILIIDPNMLLWRDKTAYIGSFTGTFINRNTAATYFGSASLLWLALILPEMKRHFVADAPFKDTLWLFTRSMNRKVIIQFAGLMICLAAVGATGSRAGLLLTLMCIVFASVIYLNPLFMTKRRSVIVVIIGAAFMLGLAYVFFGGSAGSRFASRDLSADDRFEVYGAAIAMIKDRFLLGQGLGSFEAVFPAYRPETLSQFGIWDRAHSTPLEFAVTMGVPLFVLVACLWLWFGVRLLRASLSKEHSSVVVCALFIGVLGTLHSCVDFSLQIPGYSVVFMAITASGVAQIGAKRHNKVFKSVRA